MDAGFLEALKEEMKSMLRNHPTSAGRDLSRSKFETRLIEKDGEVSDVIVRFKGPRFDNTRFDLELSASFRTLDLTKTKNSRASRSRKDAV